jgi:uncharacterized protein (DUF362 family)
VAAGVKLAMWSRRDFLKSTLVASLPPLVGGCDGSPRWMPSAYRKTARSRVAVLRAPGYESPLTDTVLRGIRLFDLEVSGKTVVLKPNFVEFDTAGVINTNPAVIAAAIEAFLTLGAREVVVAEGPGHRRDNEYLLTASGLYSILKDRAVRYVDLNYDEVRRVGLGSRFTDLGALHLPRTVLEADLLVSMPKVKTHHWAGVTLSMKNMFGIVPGAIYGWPKNVLHWSGIDGAIVDINSALAMPRFAIADGIVGMEGNGPIQGQPKPLGTLVFGADLPAVDATCARLMRIDPAMVRHLATASRFLGNVEHERIEQIGEPPDALQRDFRVLPSFDHLKV